MSRLEKASGSDTRKILILGAGFSGTYSVRYLGHHIKPTDNIQLTIISDNNFFLFTPMLHEVAMGVINTRHIAFPIRTLKWSERSSFIQTVVQSVDISRHTVTTTVGVEEYDYLILALGGVSDVSQLDPKLRNTYTLKTLHDAMLIRNHIIEMFEQAIVEKNAEKRKRMLTFVVSGAGYTGVQTVAELRDFVHKDLLKVYRSVDPGDIRIILIEAQPKIIHEMHTKLGTYVMNYLKKKGIEVWLKSRITQGRGNHVEINGKTSVDTSTIIWVTGVVANPLLAALDARTDTIGRVIVNEYLEVPGIHGVYAVGDCVHFENEKTGMVAPPRAHMAVRQARVASGNILADIRSTTKQKYHFSEAPEIVTLGTTSAVFRFGKMRIYGFPARLIWMAAYSLLVIDAHKRTRIITDWLLQLIFGRDTTLLKDIENKYDE